MHRILALAVALLSTGCQQYDVSVNERVVYSPRPVFTDVRAEDPALRRCLQEAIEARRISSPSALEELDCPRAGIRSLDGIGQFAGLRQLNLSHNAISELDELVMLEDLHTLVLEDNPVEDPSPLYRLRHLAVLELRDNPSLRCPRKDLLARVERLSLPRHCRD